ncbi:MAG TPA: hypothetical protein VK668_09010 [Mucilaginibacter sp.]|nr:hypothetical protein [Mucilaginibacter sp.]
MELTAYRGLVDQRKNCKKCQNYGLCDDLGLSHSNGNLYQVETALRGHFSIDSLGLWNPANNSNPLTASVIIIGQDFSNVGYFKNVNRLSQIDQMELENNTNKKLLSYIELSGIKINEIYFTNAILCIKGGSMNAPIKKAWINNCSNHFLKPLIIEHLVNLKSIIALGKVASDAIRAISNFSEENRFSLLAGNPYNIIVGDKQLKFYPMFHTGNLGAVNASKAKKKPEDLWKSINSILE